ncbi:MAG: 4-hydroxy-3-methylbut-2-enyl diphosphate reductase [Vulcanimicrobiota bacterium]
MLVVQAKHQGMCFGVRDALNLMRGLEHPERVTVHGELVHNPVVQTELMRRGFHQQTEVGRSLKVPTPEVLITAHGVSEKRKNALLESGYIVHDTTCPLVRRAHKACLHYHNRGYYIVLVGRKGHVEVEGLAGDLVHFEIVSKIEDLKSYPHPKIAMVNQTTTRPDELKLYHQRLLRLNPHREVKLVDTTCRPTRDRQEALEELLERVQALVVVGGPKSNNTHQLGLRAQERGLPWWRVTAADELRAEWFEGIRIVGLTAGTSTTDETVSEVAQALRKIAAPPMSA